MRTKFYKRWITTPLALTLGGICGCGVQSMTTTPPVFTGQTVAINVYQNGDFFSGYQGLTVDANGVAVRTIYDGQKAPTLGPRALSNDLWTRSKAALVVANLFADDDTYEGNGADCSEGTLSFTVHEHEKSISWEGCGSLPANLNSVLSILDCLTFATPCDASTSCDPNTLVHYVGRQSPQDCNRVLPVPPP